MVLIAFPARGLSLEDVSRQKTLGTAYSAIRQRGARTAQRRDECHTSAEGYICELGRERCSLPSR